MRKTILATLLVLLVGCWSVAMADSIAIGNGANGSNPKGLQLCSMCEPVLVGTGSDISVYPHGSASIVNDFLLAFMIPNNAGKGTSSFYSSDPLGTITVYSTFPGSGSTTGTSSAFAKPGELGLTSTNYTNSDGYWGNISSGAVSSWIGAGLSSSVNVTNISGFSSSVGVSASDWGVYVFDVTSGAVPKDGLVDISIPGGLPLGSSIALVTDTGLANPWTTAGGRGHYLHRP